MLDPQREANYLEKRRTDCTTQHAKTGMQKSTINGIGTEKHKNHSDVQKTSLCLKDYCRSQHEGCWQYVFDFDG